GLALLASVPITLFFTTAWPHPAIVLVVNLIVFTGVGVAMVDVFCRVIGKLEPARGSWPACWFTHRRRHRRRAVLRLRPVPCHRVMVHSAGFFRRFSHD